MYAVAASYTEYDVFEKHLTIHVFSVIPNEKAHPTIASERCEIPSSLH
jgi:hypothetical protein